MRLLEDSVGASLLRRTPCGVVLTAAGERLLSIAVAMERLADLVQFVPQSPALPRPCSEEEAHQPMA